MPHVQAPKAGREGKERRIKNSIFHRRQTSGPLARDGRWEGEERREGEGSRGTLGKEQDQSRDSTLALSLSLSPSICVRADAHTLTHSLISRQLDCRPRRHTLRQQHKLSARLEPSLRQSIHHTRTHAVRGKEEERASGMRERERERATRLSSRWPNPWRRYRDTRSGKTQNEKARPAWQAQAERGNLMHTHNAGGDLSQDRGKRRTLDAGKERAREISLRSRKSLLRAYVCVGE